MYFYINSEPGLYTVGCEDQAGKWYSDSDHTTPEAAGERVHYLNGGAAAPGPDQEPMSHDGLPTREPGSSCPGCGCSTLHLEGCAVLAELRQGWKAEARALRAARGAKEDTGDALLACAAALTRIAEASEFIAARDGRPVHGFAPRAELVRLGV